MTICIGFMTPFAMTMTEPSNPWHRPLFWQFGLKTRVGMPFLPNEEID